MWGIRTVSAVSGTAVIIPTITNATVATIHPLPFTTPVVFTIVVLHFLTYKVKFKFQRSVT